MANGTGISGQVYSDLVTVQANGASYRPEISADGRYITFGSDATNLVSGDTNNTGDTFVYDLVTQSIERVSVDAQGNQTYGNATLGNAVGGGGPIVNFGGVTIDGQGALQLQPDGHTIKITAVASDLGGTDPLTLTLKVSHGKIALSGLTIVNGQDGTNGVLVATGTLAQIKRGIHDRRALHADRQRQ